MKASFRNLFIGAVALGLGAIGTATATPTQWTDTYNPRDFKMTATSTYSYTHDIRDGFGGFRPGIDSISSALLTIFLYDDGDSSLEYARFRFDGGSYTGQYEIDGSQSSPDHFGFSLASLLSDGLLNVTVKATQGDFKFAKSELVVSGERGWWSGGGGSGGTVAVSEPGSLAGLGFGLLALHLALSRRRMRQGLLLR